MSCIPDCNAQDSGFHKQNFTGCRGPLHEVNYLWVKFFGYCLLNLISRSYSHSGPLKETVWSLIVPLHYKLKQTFKYRLNAMSFILYSIWHLFPLLTQLSRQRDVWNWTENILLPTLYNLPSYHYTGKAPKFIEGESGLVVGVARFRQHRVKKGKEDTL